MEECIFFFINEEVYESLKRYEERGNEQTRTVETRASDLLVRSSAIYLLQMNNAFINLQVLSRSGYNALSPSVSFAWYGNYVYFLKTHNFDFLPDLGGKVVGKMTILTPFPLRGSPPPRSGLEGYISHLSLKGSFPATYFLPLMELPFLVRKKDSLFNRALF